MGNNVTNIGTTGATRNTQQRPVPDQRAPDLAEGPPHAEVRRRPANYYHGALLRRQQRRLGSATILHQGGSLTGGAAFADFLLDQVSSKGRGSLSEPWTHLQNRIALFAQDDFKDRRPDPQPRLRWAYTSPLVEKDNRQSNFDWSTRQQLRRAERQQPGALRAVLQGLRAAPRLRLRRQATAGCSAAATASRSTWKAPAPTCGCRSTRRSSSSRQSATTRHGPGTHRHRVRGAAGRSTSRRASSAPGIRTCGRSSRSSGTSSPSTC